MSAMLVALLSALEIDSIPESLSVLSPCEWQTLTDQSLMHQALMQRFEA